MAVGFIKLRGFCFMITKLFVCYFVPVSLSALFFGDTSHLTFLLGGSDNSENVDFKLLNLQNKYAIPNLVTVEVNIYKHVCKPDIKEKWSLKC